MKIKFRQSGGFAGFRKSYEVDTEQMAPQDREQLESLVEQSGLRDSHEDRSPRARDVTEYEINVEKGDGTYRVVVDDLTAPDTLKPLLAFLQKHAKSVRKP